MELQTRKQLYRSNLVLGTQYYRQPTPTSAEWKDDLEKIREMGMEFIQVRPQWRWHERQEGRYEWEDIDVLLDLAKKTGLKVIFKFMLETAPDYIFKRYDGYRLGLKGERIWPIAHGAFYPGGWAPCFDNTSVIEKALAFVKTAVARYGEQEVICLWHAWNEPRCRPVGECTCSHSIESYHHWLIDHFRTVGKLNDFLGKCWGSFDDIDAPRDTADFAEMFLWRQWAASRVAWRVAEVRKAINEVDSTREVIAHVGMPSITQDVLNDTSDDYLTRKSVDFYGCSFEVRYTPKPLDLSWPFLIADWAKSISGNGYFWINEMYPSRARWAPEVSPETVAYWYWAGLACGAKGIILWQFKKERVGTETNEAGVVETDGRENAISRKLRDVLSVIRENEQVFQMAQVPKARVAMVYDFESDLVSRIEETQHLGDISLVNDLPSGYVYKSALHGAYHLFWLIGEQIDLLSSHELERINNYELVYLPTFLVVDHIRAKIFKDYVSGGGKLIAEGGIAQRDTNTWLHTTRPGAGLTHLFGAVEVDRVVHQEEKRTLVLPGGGAVTSRFMNASFETGQANILAKYKDGGAAVIENSFGKGKAMMTGFSPGLAYLLEPQNEWPNWICHLLYKWGGLPDTARPGKGVVYVRELQSAHAGLTFVFNTDTTKKDWSAPHSGRDLISGRKYEEGAKIQIPPLTSVVLLTRPESHRNLKGINPGEKATPR
ncbi:MAG: hypothetical protein GWP14_03540 [Actinobacteria bacterium]|nr:hypothetical protein [Actinomycetota bacterium]